MARTRWRRRRRICAGRRGREVAGLFAEGGVAEVDIVKPEAVVGAVGFGHALEGQAAAVRVLLVGIAAAGEDEDGAGDVGPRSGAGSGNECRTGRRRRGRWGRGR